MSFQGFVFVVFVVCFLTGGSSKIDEKQCAGHQKQRVQKISNNRYRARFLMDLGFVLEVNLAKNMFVC